jgi:hypothetical protein
MTQYLPLHKLEPDDFRALVNTFRSAFPECMLLRGIAHGVLVGRRDRPLAIDYGRLSGLFDRMPPVSAAALAGPMCLLTARPTWSGVLSSTGTDWLS